MLEVLLASSLRSGCLPLREVCLTLKPACLAATPLQLCLPPEARKNLSPRERVSDGEANKGRYFGYKEQHVQNHGDESGKSWRLCLVGALNAFGRMLREETRVGGGDETES